MIFKLIHPTLGTTLGVFTTRSAAKREAARANFPTEIVEVEAMVESPTGEKAPREAPPSKGCGRAMGMGVCGSSHLGVLRLCVWCKPVAAPLPSAPEARAAGAAEVGQGFRSPATCPKCGGRLDRMIPTPNGVARKRCQGCDMVYKVAR